MSEKGKEVVVESPTHNHKAICVFAGTKLGSEGVYNDAAKELGQEIAARKINLVYRGGIEGLNGSVALTAAMRESHVLGFMTHEARQLIISSSDVKQLLDQMISLAPDLGLPMRPVNQNLQDRGGRDPQDRGGSDEPDTALRL